MHWKDILKLQFLSKSFLTNPKNQDPWITIDLQVY